MPVAWTGRQGETVTQAKVRYLFNREPETWPAALGVLFVKGLMAVPHLIIIGVLQQLAFLGGYVGYFIVAFTGALPAGIQDFTEWLARWTVRVAGWYAGVTDRYPPFENEPGDYLPDAEVPRNEAPSRGWAVAGIFGIKYLAIIPHLIVLAFLVLGVLIASWIGFFIVLFRGSLPEELQDFALGTAQWQIRVYAWTMGLTDEYPPFDLLVHPLDYQG
jgi:hypothetical protein